MVEWRNGQGNKNSGWFSRIGKKRAVYTGNTGEKKVSGIAGTDRKI
jgi:hypothetical protein